MRNSARTLWVVSLSLCFVLQPTMAIQAQTDLIDSDEFYQRTVRRPQLAFIDAISEVCAMSKDVSSPATVVSVKRLVLELEADSTSFITLRVKPDRRQSRETVSVARERRGITQSSARGNEDLG